jgi:hypothetical protein
VENYLIISENDRPYDGKVDAAPNRRRSLRFEVKEGIFAQLVPDCGKLGQIKDISLLGLSFNYVKEDQCISEPSKLRIIVSGSGLFLGDISIETITDSEIEGGFSLSALKLHRTGLKFSNLSAEQEKQLRRFIREHTTEELA